MSAFESVARVAQLLMGVVMLIAGAAKVWDPVLFYWASMPSAQMLGVPPEWWPRVGRLAQIISPFECALGLSLLLNWRPRLVYPVATALIAFFAALAAYGWKLGVTSNCGCFGALVDRTPAEATIENSAMLLAVGFAWWGTRSLPSTRPLGRWVAVVTAASVVVLGMRFLPEVDRLDGSDLQVGVNLEDVDLNDLDIDLGEGKYLVELFSPTCGRCRNAVPKLNKWVEIPGLPPIVALHHLEPKSAIVAEFKQSLRPRFHIGSISFIDFRRLTWQAGFPRLAYVKDGEVKAVWEHDEMPTPEQLKNLVAW